MRILLFGGFLGSGKTTTMLQVAKYLTDVHQETVAIIENEVGAAGIDDKLFSASGLKVKQLFGGCVCCQIGSDLISAISEIHGSIHPDWLLIEMTGLAFPSKTAATIKKYSTVYSAFKTVTIVDRARWSELKLMLEPLVTGQIKGSDLIVLNKTDLIAGEDVKSIIKDLKEIDAHITVVITSAINELPPDVLEEIVSYE
ncbi:MAG TPA: GTP-binding protein [Methylomusa anaerophila]|uniref:Putative GTP-binding protein YjiA n=1 Tax=Methylomusa anaerophila TaxID=1930071 RepID=A0A348AL66_9FIRM|nr:GTP-binding protein [Methylomusa anaerophila]BBB91814.1 putative GTP-binding protein YjiA [Methylomusa anaerophila]HML88452.1 GTP-binding protein [Methylomusa anaerophila]